MMIISDGDYSMVIHYLLADTLHEPLIGITHLPFLLISPCYAFGLCTYRKYLCKTCNIITITINKKNNECSTKKMFMQHKKRMKIISTKTIFIYCKCPFYDLPIVVRDKQSRRTLKQTRRIFSHIQIK